MPAIWWVADVRRRIKVVLCPMLDTQKRYERSQLGDFVPGLDQFSGCS